MEHRKEQKATVKSSPLPSDFLKLVSEIFSNNFEAGLKSLKKIKPAPAHFEASGRIYPDEIVLSVTLVHEGQIASTTVYASADFDPKASSPTIQELLERAVDAAGSVFADLFSEKPGRLEQLADESLAALEEVPFEWTALEVGKRTLYVKVDKSNPALDQMADEWLAKRDPEAAARLKEEQSQAERLFVTGPRPGEKKRTVH